MRPIKSLLQHDQVAKRVISFSRISDHHVSICIADTYPAAYSRLSTSPESSRPTSPLGSTSAVSWSDVTTAPPNYTERRRQGRRFPYDSLLPVPLSQRNLGRVLNSDAVSACTSDAAQLNSRQNSQLSLASEESQAHQCAVGEDPLSACRLPPITGILGISQAGRLSASSSYSPPSHPFSSYLTYTKRDSKATRLIVASDRDVSSSLKALASNSLIPMWRGHVNSAGPEVPRKTSLCESSLHTEGVEIAPNLTAVAANTEDPRALLMTAKEEYIVAA
ncbi:unnamed protein product, partial [Protopolystoma xenopodis]